MPGRQHWSVTVSRNGEPVVTIELNMLAGRDLSPEDEVAVRTAAHHLLAFLGERPVVSRTETADPALDNHPKFFAYASPAAASVDTVTPTPGAVGHATVRGPAWNGEALAIRFEDD